MEPGTRRGARQPALPLEAPPPPPTRRRQASTFGRHLQSLPLTEGERATGPLTAEEEARAAGLQLRSQLRAQIGDPYGRSET